MQKEGEIGKNQSNNCFRAISGFLKVIIFLIALSASGFLVFAGAIGIADIRNTEVSRYTKAEMGPKDSVELGFSQKVNRDIVEQSLQQSLGEGVNFTWSSDDKTLSIKPDKFWESGKNYSAVLKYNEDIVTKETKEFKFSFQIKEKPGVVSISPVTGDPKVKIDSPVKLDFDRSTIGYDVNIVTVPFIDSEIVYGADRKSVILTPKNKLKYATDYAVSVTEEVSGSEIASSAMSEVYRANFKTESEPPPPPEEKNKVTAVPDDQVADNLARIESGKYIDINLAKQQLSIFEDGKRLGSYKVSSGKKGMATPTGTFHILSKQGRAWSKKYGLYMPYWMQFTTLGHGIHELPEWPGGYKEGANHLGIPVSHGCVRLGVGPAATIYNWAEIGTAVVIHY
ncbi:MAG: L,D-transpeptidase family protein [Parcubacteria group bacterium]|jgi:lipoprotein-anchoring transpeptidase ErfK/SrfK